MIGRQSAPELPHERGDITAHNFRGMVEDLAGERFLAQPWPNNEIVREGGESFCFCVKDKALNLRRGVLKLAKPDARNNKRIRARFFRGAAIQALLHQKMPKAVPDIFEVQESYYVVEYIDGKEVLDWLAGNEPMPMMAKILRIANEIHEWGILYRDWKPQNIIIDKQGNPHLIDFGLAKRVDDPALNLTKSSDRIGTPLFWTDRLSTDPTTADFDDEVQLLGKILWVLNTGRMPESDIEYNAYLAFSQPEWAKYYFDSQSLVYRTAKEFLRRIERDYNIEAAPAQPAPMQGRHVLLTVEGLARVIDSITEKIEGGQCELL